MKPVLFFVLFFFLGLSKGPNSAVEFKTGNTGKSKQDLILVLQDGPPEQTHVSL